MFPNNRSKKENRKKKSVTLYPLKHMFAMPFILSYDIFLCIATYCSYYSTYQTDDDIKVMCCTAGFYFASFNIKKEKIIKGRSL